MENTFRKITHELNNILKNIKSKYWTLEEENEENREKKRKETLWMIAGIVGGLGGLSALAWYLFSRRSQTRNSNKKLKSNYISDLISEKVEKTKETLWMKNLEPYLNDTTSYYQYMVKSKQSSRDSIQFDPQWRISPSYTIETNKTKKKKNQNSNQANGFVQYRTQSLTGREAGLPRIFSNEDDSTLKFINPQSTTSSTNNWIFYLEKIRYIISLLFYRLPRAAAEWELWLGACSAAIYFVVMNQPFGFRKRNSQEDSNSKNSMFMDGVMHRVVKSTESSSKSTPKVVKLIGEGLDVQALEKSFDEMINNKESNQGLSNTE